MSDKDWEKLMAKVDKEIASIPESAPAPAPAKPAPRPSASGGAVRAPAPARPADPVVAGGAVWPAYLRLVLATALGIGVYFWPYENRCGVGLYGYLFVVLVVAVSGVWSAVWTWRHQTAKAHVVSILLIVWGLVLGGSEVLPRIGYAKRVLPWACTVPGKR